MFARDNSEGKQFSTFRVGTLLLGIEVVTVQEVLRYQEMTVVPLAPYAVEGLINLRGQIVIALDMRKSLGLPRRPVGTRPMNVVIQSQDASVSLLVDDIGDVIETSAAVFGLPPDNLPANQKELVAGIYTLPHELLLILNTERLLLNACNPISQISA
ncbi:chemotaxis protein CheW [Acidipila sp. EB88]|uniref:chemotaxis protein CheW n=1 Tax=Acidipila sp. EB88 TaxID=2305226 RepID=UPI000F5E43B5|nr:chemotaxis protein CheW [Acidipila sp. EB88]RRA47171.1 purine-binding chemotaxis protein CheW [Acidipila sp. EB88]